MKQVRKANAIWLTGIAVVLTFSALATAASAEMTEAEKKALEAEKKALELASEDPKQEADEQETVLTEAEKKALEAAKKSAEGEQGGQEPGQDNDQVTASKLQGRISAIGPNTLTVGIVGDNTVTVTGQTEITFNGQISNLARLHIADKVSVKYDSATGNALLIEAEGFLFKSTYEDVTTVTYLGMLGHIPGLHFGFITANGAGVKLDPGLTEVTVNGVPATIANIRVGDGVDYVQNALDLKAFWVKVTR